MLEDELSWLRSSSQSSASTDVRTKQMGRDREAALPHEIVSEGRKRHGTICEREIKQINHTEL